jgi:Ca-activated chloride channel family protein
VTWDFLHPGRLWWLLGVAVLGAAYVISAVMRRRRALRFANVAMLDRIAPRGRGWLRHLLAAISLVGFTIGVLALAQPVDEVRVPKQRATVILALDTSLSMKATDVTPSRIAAAKTAAKKFVRSLPPKLNVGLVSFDDGARLDVAPTTDRRSVLRAIDALELSEKTAIGDAVKTSINAIQRVPKGADGKDVPGVIVLLSDGATTVGLPTEEAGPLAKRAGIPVWTIAYGTSEGVVDITLPDTGETARVRVPVDTEALQQLSRTSGGKAYTAESARDLAEVYEKLGSSIGYDIEQREVTWRYLAAAMALLGLSAVAGTLFFQRLP